MLMMVDLEFSGTFRSKNFALRVKGELCSCLLVKGLVRIMALWIFAISARMPLSMACVSAILHTPYVTSADSKAYNESQLLEAIRGHCDSIENGSHHRRDVSMGEDASGISKRPQLI